MQNLTTALPNTGPSLIELPGIETHRGALATAMTYNADAMTGAYSMAGWENVQGTRARLRGNNPGYICR